MAEAVAGSVTHAVIFELPGIICCVVPPDKAHFRKNTVHLVYQDFCTKAQEVKVLGKDDSAVDTSELRYEVGICDDVF